MTTALVDGSLLVTGRVRQPPRIGRASVQTAAMERMRMKPRYARTAPRTIALKTRAIAIRQGDNSVSDEATRVALWCAPMHRAIALLLLTTSCAHSVTVLAPVADVPEGTPIVVAVSPGNVTQFQRDATLGKD